MLPAELTRAHILKAAAAAPTQVIKKYPKIVDIIYFGGSFLARLTV